MQGLRSASLIKRLSWQLKGKLGPELQFSIDTLFSMPSTLLWSGFISGYYRGLSSLSSNNALSDDLDNIVLVEGKAWSRTAILNRHSVLNALNTAVGARLQKLYKSWEDNPDIGFVVLKVICF
ncbi:hypothetical protein TEA_012184 [Camellia sinensis var. sinensis]|uniref:Enoyl-CoA hydratase/isomerase domain-containing protein n=1 Tax=Camellia sinensis var. sinensis TaxID=542762 RepID=A0A4S4EWR4_CAMSN|nr:hypothetical protein TEA_012184 [Camellia sinensis var. sinensis]